MMARVAAPVHAEGNTEIHDKIVMVQKLMKCLSNTHQQNISLQI
jgi:hypothetical protein